MSALAHPQRSDYRTRELIEIIRTSPDETERDEALELVTVAHMPLARSLAHRYAHELALTPERIREAQVAASNLRPASLDATTSEGGRPVLDLVDARVDTRSDPALDDGILVRTAIRRLPARDQQLVKLRFDADLTQAEIASSMGLSAMQVSRLLRRVLDELRRQLDSAGVTA